MVLNNEIVKDYIFVSNPNFVPFTFPQANFTLTNVFVPVPTTGTIVPIIKSENFVFERIQVPNAQYETSSVLYTGEKGVFQINMAFAIKPGSNLQGTPTLTLMLYKGHSFQFPTIQEPSIVGTLTVQQVSGADQGVVNTAANGIIELEKNDVLALYIQSDTSINANSLVFEEFMLNIVRI